MAVPKRRHSPTRGRKRRTHWKLRKPGVSACSHCSSPKIPHRICPTCGFYDGEEIRMPSTE
ncbi:MAG: 50S ribosomal protein L32 [Candidatus Eisenbacteria bacterium]|uniref:Large ribosomal subunit protein bL32 n=1 Tax=Eiseniibacteriota bacterium TaxID=2212470 RepID=A0A849SGQ1_UNCEI|nr:50S ribosomal protein L32 [Candidatus Eisenbacteria bacterium]